jgi:hypothetical protein
VDVYLPPGSRVAVAPGQRTIGGETVLATLPGSVAAGSTLPGSVEPGSTPSGGS